MNPVEPLCYAGNRGMGALEFEPSAAGLGPAGAEFDIAAMVDLASAVVSDHLELTGVLAGEGDAEALREILRVGTSAGGVRKSGPCLESANGRIPFRPDYVRIGI